MIVSPAIKPGAVPGEIERTRNAEHTESIRSIMAKGVSVTTRGTHHTPVSRFSQRDRAHFRVDQYDADKVVIHGGSYIRRTRTAGVPPTRTKLAVAAGDGGIYDSLTAPITCTAATGWIIVTLNSASTPPTLTASYVATTHPVTADLTAVKWVLAEITMVAGVITKIEQCFSGDINMDFIIADTDRPGTATNSITTDTNGALIIYGFASAGVDTVPWVDTTAPNKHVSWMATTGAGGICTTAAAIAGTTPTAGGALCTDLHTHVIDPSGFSVSYAATAGNAATVTSIADHDHGELSGLQDDGHPQYLKLAGDKARNKMAIGSEIGDNAGSLVASFNLSTLYRWVSGAGVAIFNWSTGLFKTSGGVESLSVEDRTLRGPAGSVWTVGVAGTAKPSLDVLNDTDASTGAGSITTAGGIAAAKKLRTETALVIGPTALNSWSASAFNVMTTGQASLESYTSVYISSGTYVSLYASTNIFIKGNSGVYYGTNVVDAARKGQDVTDFVASGGIVNPAVVESRVADLGPNDRVLCIRG